MDTAVALVQAYLHVNGYFTVTEYPVLEALNREHTRAVTDLDVLAFRFAHAAHDIKRGRGRRHLDERPAIPDPVLGSPTDCPDMIVGEVKEGVARFNAAARDPIVIEVALARFGCCAPEHVGALTRQLRPCCAARSLRWRARWDAGGRDFRTDAPRRGVFASPFASPLGGVATSADSRARVRCARPAREVGHHLYPAAASHW